MKKWQFFYALVLLISGCTKNQIGDDIVESSLGQSPVKNLETVCSTSGITQDSGMLVFRNMNHFRTTLECLESAMENHEAAFEGQNSHLSDEDFNLMADSIGFRDFLPLEEFEQDLNFNSRRQMVENMIQSWLNSPVLDTLNDPDDLDNLSEELRTLLSIDGKVIIGGEIYDYLNDPEEKSSSCRLFSGSKKWVPYDNNLKKYKLKVSVASYPWKAKQKAKITNYRQGNGLSWKRYKTNLFIQVGGFVRDNDCNFPLQTGNAIGPNRRSALKTKRVVWQPPTLVKYKKREIFCAGEVVNYGQSEVLLLSW